MSIVNWFDAYEEMKESGELEKIPKEQRILQRPSMDEVLAEWGPMPNEAMLMGAASDGLPVLLNLHDPVPGPILVIGDGGSGKTAFLKTIAGGVERMHQKEKVQFGVVTAHPNEWNKMIDIPNCVGVFSVHHKSSEDFILSMASWAHGNKASQQSVLLLLDDLTNVSYLDFDAVQNLRWLLLRGPSRRVWPIITMPASGNENVQAWMEAFRTRIYGKIKGDSAFRDLEGGVEFKIREGDRYVQFWIPEI